MDRVKRAVGAALVGVVTVAAALHAPELTAAFALASMGVLAAGVIAPRRAEAEEFEGAAIARDAQAILDASPDACVVLRNDGTIVWANAAAGETFGTFSPGNPFSFTIRAPELVSAVERVARTGRAEQVRWSEKVPTERWYQAFVRTFTLSSGTLHPRGAVVIFVRDLTQQQRLDRMREDFVANASHELRTPLAALSGFIETLQGPARDDPKAREQFLGVMRQQAERMRRLTDALLSLSRIEMRAHVRPTDVVDFAEIARYGAEMMRKSAKEHNVEIALDIASEPVEVRGDRDELIQVADNLIENAVKYGGGGGRILIHVGLDEAQETGVLSVEDFGAGIGPEHVPRLTERFYRVEAKGPAAARRGTGLGLAIVKHIIARHRGRLTVRSQLSAGSTFTVRVPLAAPATTDETSSPA